MMVYTNDVIYHVIYLFICHAIYHAIYHPDAIYQLQTASQATAGREQGSRNLRSALGTRKQIFANLFSI
jgi:hypothetical protein